MMAFVSFSTLVPLVLARIVVGRRGFAGLAGLAFLAALVPTVLIPTGPARAIETTAKQAILMDFETGTVLMEKNARSPMYPASMTKVMTAYIAFQRLSEGRLSLDDEIPVSEKAWRKGGSKMFIEVGNRVRVEDILRGIIVQSGNDASIALAEALSGTEGAFAEKMNETALDIGMTDTQFRNSTGWPDPEHYTTAYDLARLAQRLIADFPEYYHYYSETEFTWNEIRQGNRNPLLYRPGLGADGLKTGHTEAAGYGLTASAKRGDQRLIAVINGLDSVRARGTEAEKILEWGFRNFENRTLFKAGDTVEEAGVWLGVEETVPLVTKEPVRLTLPRSGNADMTAVVRYDGPIPAPIAEGAHVATLTVSATDLQPIEIPLYAAHTVEKLGFMGRILAAARTLVFGAVQ